MNPDDTAPGLHSELLIMPDGTIFVHNLTPEMAAVLRLLNPTDTAMGRRAPAPLPEAPGIRAPLHPAGSLAPGPATSHPSITAL